MPRAAPEHHLTTDGPPDLPPLWLMVDTLIIAQLTGSYRNPGERADKTAVATCIRLTAPVLESWMQTYVRVREHLLGHG